MSSLRVLHCRDSTEGKSSLPVSKIIVIVQLKSESIKRDWKAEGLLLRDKCHYARRPENGSLRNHIKLLM